MLVNFCNGQVKKKKKLTNMSFRMRTVMVSFRTAIRVMCKAHARHASSSIPLAGWCCISFVSRV